VENRVRMTLSSTHRRASNARGMTWRAALRRSTLIVALIGASYFALIVGAILLLTLIVGSSAAVVVLLYYVAHLFMHLFGFSFRWGLVTSCGLLFVCCGAAGLIHDIRLTVMPPEPAERETTLTPAVAGPATQHRVED
jgi:hypothetical protein